MVSSGRPGVGRRQRGQGQVEFALTLPIMLVLVFGVLEGSLAMFTIDSARFAAGEAARQVAASGTDTNADTLAVQLIRTGPFGTTSLAKVNHIDIYRLVQQANGQFTVDATKINSYQLDGTAIGAVNWLPSTRNARNGSADFVGLTIYYQYNWLSGRLLASGPLQLTQPFYVRIEPQSY
jgi:Flp pilus assembly protein TadG